MYTNHRHYTLLVLAFFTLIVTTVGFLYLRSRVYTQAFSVFDIEREVAATEDAMMRERDAKTTFTKIAEDQKKISAYVVDTKNIVTFIEEVERIGEATGTELELSNIQTKAVSQSADVRNNFTKVEAGIVVKGGWQNVMRALTLLENLPYAVVLDKISLTEEAAAASTPDKPAPIGRVWRLTLQIRALAL